MGEGKDVRERRREKRESETVVGMQNKKIIKKYKPPGVRRISAALLQLQSQVAVGYHMHPFRL